MGSCLHKHVEKWGCGAQRGVMTAMGHSTPISVHRMQAADTPCALHLQVCALQAAPSPCVCWCRYSGLATSLCPEAPPPAVSLWNSCGAGRDSATWWSGGLPAILPLFFPFPFMGVRPVTLREDCPCLLLLPLPISSVECPSLSLLYSPLPFGICFIEDLS